MAEDKPTEERDPQLPEDSKDSIIRLARFAVRAYFQGNTNAVAEAMEALNSAFAQFDGINYKVHAATIRQEKDDWKP